MHFHFLFEILRNLDTDTRSTVLAVVLGIPLAGCILHVLSRRQDRLMNDRDHS